MKAIKIALLRFGRNSRYLDKSQIYTINAKVLNKILEDSNPYFILVTRNPYVSIYRAAILMDRDDLHNNIKMKFSDKLKYCSQHWRNSMISILGDSSDLKNFYKIKIEDFIIDCESELKRMCEFLELNYDKGMLPAVDHKLPYFTRYRSRWYPIKKDLNSKYKEEITDENFKIIQNEIQELACELGYEGI